MSPHRERVVRGSVVSEHLVHLFDEPQSLVDTVATYLCEGWRRGDILLVVARASHWALASAELAARECPVDELVAEGRLVVLDAPTTLASFMVNGEPDPNRFQQSVGTHVRQLCRESSAGLTIYGEMVDILAAQGNFIAAEHLEALWNTLLTECSFRLLCGYSSSHFGDERAGKNLDKICGLHTGSGSHATDLLASWLLADRLSKFHIPTR
jgi:hypothetical protein